MPAKAAPSGFKWQDLHGFGWGAIPTSIASAPTSPSATAMEDYFWEYLRGQWIQMPTWSLDAKPAPDAVGPLEPGVMFRTLKVGSVAILDPRGRLSRVVKPGTTVVLADGRACPLWSGSSDPSEGGVTVSVILVDKMFCVDAQVGDIRLRLAIDSTSPDTEISPAALAKMKDLKPIKPSGMSPDLPRVQIDTLQIGTLALHQVRAVVHRSDETSDAKDSSIDGILGYDTLRSLALGFDFDRLELTLWDRPEPWTSEKAFFETKDDPVYTPIRNDSSWNTDGKLEPEAFRPAIDIFEKDAIWMLDIDTCFGFAVQPNSLPEAKGSTSLIQFQGMAHEQLPNSKMQVENAFHFCDLEVLSHLIFRIDELDHSGLLGCETLNPFGKALFDFSNQWLGIKGSQKQAWGSLSQCYVYGIQEVGGKIKAKKGWAVANAGVDERAEIKAINLVDISKLKHAEALQELELMSLYVSSSVSIWVDFEENGKPRRALVTKPNVFTVSKETDKRILERPKSSDDDVVVTIPDSIKFVVLKPGEWKVFPAGSTAIGRPFSCDFLPSGEVKIMNFPSGKQSVSTDQKDALSHVVKAGAVITAGNQTYQIPPGSKITFNSDGSLTITYPDGVSLFVQRPKDGSSIEIKPN